MAGWKKYDQVKDKDTGAVGTVKKSLRKRVIVEYRNWYGFMTLTAEYDRRWINDHLEHWPEETCDMTGRP